MWFKYNGIEIGNNKSDIKLLGPITRRFDREKFYFSCDFILAKDNIGDVRDRINAWMNGSTGLVARNANFYLYLSEQDDPGGDDVLKFEQVPEDLSDDDVTALLAHPTLEEVPDSDFTTSYSRHFRFSLEIMTNYFLDENKINRIQIKTKKNELGVSDITISGQMTARVMYGEVYNAFKNFDDSAKEDIFESIIDKFLGKKYYKLYSWECDSSDGVDAATGEGMLTVDFTLGAIQIYTEEEVGKLVSDHIVDPKMSVTQIPWSRQFPEVKKTGKPGTGSSLSVAGSKDKKEYKYAVSYSCGLRVSSDKIGGPGFTQGFMNIPEKGGWSLNESKIRQFYDSILRKKIISSLDKTFSKDAATAKPSSGKKLETQTTKTTSEYHIFNEVVSIDAYKPSITVSMELFSKDCMYFSISESMVEQTMMASAYKILDGADNTEAIVRVGARTFATTKVSVTTFKGYDAPARSLDVSGTGWVALQATKGQEFTSDNVMTRKTSSNLIEYQPLVTVTYEIYMIRAKKGSRTTIIKRTGGSGASGEGELQIKDGPSGATT